MADCFSKSELDVFLNLMKLPNIEYLLYVIDTALTEVETELYSKIDRTVAAFQYANLCNSGD